MRFERASAIQLTKSILSIIAAIFGLIIISMFNYLLFHTASEIVSIVIAYSVLVIALNTHKFTDNHYILFVSVALAFAMIIELIHTISYPGVNIIPGADLNMTNQLWISARYLLMSSFLIAPYFIDKKINLKLTLVVYALITAILLVLIYIKLYPTMYIEGVGQTAFKIISEYIIVAGFLLSAYMLYKNRLLFTNKQVHYWLLGSILLLALSDSFFTLYTQFTDLTNMLGHLFNITGFFFMYKAIIILGLKDPTQSLYGKLKEAEELFRNKNEECEMFFNNVSDALMIVDLDKGTLVNVNPALTKIIGYTENELVGKPFINFIHSKDKTKIKDYFSDGKLNFKSRLILRNGSFKNLEWSIKSLPEKHIAYVIAKVKI